MAVRLAQCAGVGQVAMALGPALSLSVVVPLCGALGPGLLDLPPLVVWSCKMLQESTHVELEPQPDRDARSH